MKIIKLAKSFKHALAGLWYAVKTERNMRIHISVANLIIPFAYLYGIERWGWALLVLAIGFVIFAELVNTSIECGLDAFSKEYNVNIKHAKDIAAGGVVISTIVAVAVGFVLFGDINRIEEVLTYLFTHTLHTVIFLSVLVIDLIFIMIVKEKK